MNIKGATGPSSNTLILITALWHSKVDLHSFALVSPKDLHSLIAMHFSKSFALTAALLATSAFASPAPRRDYVKPKPAKPTPTPTRPTTQQVNQCSNGATPYCVCAKIRNAAIDSTASADTLLPSTVQHRQRRAIHRLCIAWCKFAVQLNSNDCLLQCQQRESNQFIGPTSQR